MPSRGIPPFDGGAGDGEVLEAAADEAEDFVAFGIRLNETGIGFVMREEFFGEGGELEEVVFLGNGFGGAAAVGAGIAGFGVVDVEFVEDAVLAGVGAFIDVAGVEAALEEPADGFVVAGFGGADEVVVLDADAVPEGAVFVGDDGGEFLGGASGGLGGALDFLAVLVGAGGEDGVVTLHAFEALDGVGREGGVGVADVGRGVDVVDRRGEVVFHFFSAGGGWPCFSLRDLSVVTVSSYSVEHGGQLPGCGVAASGCHGWGDFQRGSVTVSVQ